MKIQDVQIGHKFEVKSKGEGVIIAKTSRTLTAKFQKCTTKVSYRYLNSNFLPSDFSGKD